MDELFGSDGDSDNDQRGIFLLSFRYKLFTNFVAGIISRRFLADAINLSIAIRQIEMRELVPKTVCTECECLLFVAICVVDRICLFVLMFLHFFFYFTLWF